jgi:hypothetical protein
VSSTIPVGDDVGDDVVQSTLPVDIDDKGYSRADGVQVLSLKYESDIDDDDTDDDCEFDTDKMLLENLQTILEAKNNVVVDDDDEDMSSVVENSPSRKRFEQVLSPGVDDAPPVIPGVAPVIAPINDEAFLGWMNNPAVSGVPCAAPAPVVPACDTKLKQTSKGAPASAKSPKRDKKQAMLPQRRSPARAAKTKSEISKERLSV